MKLFIPFTFVVLGLVYFEMSGGADFVPETRPAPQASAEPAAAAPEIVTRADASAAADPAALGVLPAALAQPVAALDTKPDDAPGADAVDAAVIEAAATVVPEVQTDAAPAVAPEAEPEFVSLAAPAADQRLVTASTLNVRSGPSTEDVVLTTLLQSQSVTVLEDSADGWSLIRIEADGTEGWVASQYLSE